MSFQTTNRPAADQQPMSSTERTFLRSPLRGGACAFAAALVFAVSGGSVCAQGDGEPPGSTRPTFDQASNALDARLRASVEELTALREAIRQEQVPLNKQLRDLEATYAEVRRESQDKSQELSTRDFEVGSLEKEIKSREAEKTYLSGLFEDYAKNFAATIHIAEKQRHREAIDTALLAPEDANLSDREKFERQAALLGVSIDRLRDALGGVRFEGRAKDSSGYLANGTFVVVGPAALFRSTSGTDVGTAEARIGSEEPAVIPFKEPAILDAASGLVANGAGDMPLDPTLGNAHKIAALEETFLEHIQKGGAVMFPLFGMAAIALILALIKWISMAFLRNPSRKQVEALLADVGRRDHDAAMGKASQMRGPVGRMLYKGVENMGQAHEYVEELMYEMVLRTRLRLQSYLPFIAICAASAPLLGLLGTVTGIISTFKLITAFGSGDASTLSGGISEALITTKFGLIVAIPSLLLHAYLSRKARGVVGEMETNAIAFMNQLGKTQTKSIVSDRPEAQIGSAEPDPALVRRQVSEILHDMLGPAAADGAQRPGAAPTAGTT